MKRTNKEKKNTARSAFLKTGRDSAIPKPLKVDGY
jgi:hypothetical protein